MQKKTCAIFGREEIDGPTHDQMENAMNLPVSVQGALIPDAHLGYGLPIGGVLATRNTVIPFGVGMDIGCRMHLSVFDIDPVFIDKEQNAIKKILKDNTRFGKASFEKKKDHPVLGHSDFHEIKFLKSLHQKVHEQLGTSGSGNHFVDVGIFILEKKHSKLNIKPGAYLAVLSHSGSRNFGAEIARHYTRVAKSKTNLPKNQRQLAWLDLSNDDGKEYWRAMELAGLFSAANHEIIHNSISDALKTSPIVQIENHHNFAWKEKLPSGETVIMHRKGATPAHKGILGIIPGSMIHPAYIVEGKGCHEALNSASHGAGRCMSRNQAKQNFTKKELQQTLDKAGVHLIGGSTDETPLAYKNIETIMQYQDKMVNVLANFIPKIVIMDKN